MDELTTIPPSPPVPAADGDGHAAVRRRWRAAGDRLWLVALSDGEAYQRAAGAVGRLLDRLRAQAHSVEDLLRVEQDPAGHLAEDDVPAAPGPDLLAAACAMRADEIDAADGARRRRAAIGAARDAGATWVTLTSTPTRVVEMHLGTGRAVVATSDLYDPDRPYVVGAALLDARTGDTLAGTDEEQACATHDAWAAARAARRNEIERAAPARDTAGHDPMEGS